MRKSLIAVICCAFFVGCGPAALESEDAHKSADALYTAITSRRTDLLDSVESDLKKLATEQKLSADAMEQLQSFIELARNDAWQQAAQKLDRFIRDQPHHENTH